MIQVRTSKIVDSYQTKQQNTMHSNIKVNYLLKDVLGQGAYGKVFLGESKTTNEKVAVKMQRKMADKDQGLSANIIREVSILKHLNHENIIKVRDNYEDQKDFYLVLEYVEDDLKKLLKSHAIQQKPIPTKDIKGFMLQLLNGILHCKKNFILHRDIKPDNVLISKEGKLKITDFGLAKQVAFNGSPLRSEVVTLLYRAPELLLGSENYSYEIDIWSIGCIFAELYALEPMFPGNNIVNQLRLIFDVMGTPNHQRHPSLTTLKDWKPNLFPDRPPQSLRNFIPSLDNDAEDLLKKMLELEPTRRISVEEALKHPYFKSA